MNGAKSGARLALFDIDGTLLNEPSSEKRFMLWLFLKGRIGPIRLLAYALFALRYFPRYGRGVFTKNKSLLWRRTVGNVEGLAREWAVVALQKALYGPCLERLRAHQQAGDIVVLLSGTPSVLADAIAQRLGVDNVVATECALRAGRYAFAPPIVHCVGEVKLASARDLCARFEATLADTAAYGNSLSDLPLLGACGIPVAVNPDSALAAIACEKNWEVIGSPARNRIRASAACALALSALLCCPPAGIAQDALPGAVNRVLAHYGIPRENYSVWVRDMGEDQPLLSHRADVPRKPASVIKVLTGWLALEGLGPEYRWITRVYLGGELRNGVLDGPLILEGRGDPHLVMERVWLLQRQLRQRGLRRIDGPLVLDDRWLPADDMPVAGFEADRHRSFSASPYALLMNFQAIRVIVEPDPARSRVHARLDPPLAGLELVNRLRLSGGRCGGFQRGVAVRITGQGDNRVELDGNYSRRCNSYSISRRALSGPAYAYGLFAALWREGGGEISEGYRLGSAPEEAEPWLEFKSEFAFQAVRFMNKHSNNVMARQLLLTLGAEMFGPPATPDKARRAAGEVLKRAGLELPSLILDNGSGLSRVSRISAADLGRLLVHASLGPRFPELAASLPIAGRDGTLTRTYGETPFGGRAHIKTGSLNGVSAIAGYVLAESGRRLAVVALMEHPLAAKGPGEEAHGQLLTAVSLD